MLYRIYVISLNRSWKKSWQLACLAKLHTVLNCCAKRFFPVTGIIPHLSTCRNLTYNSAQILVSQELKRKPLEVGSKYLNPGLRKNIFFCLRSRTCEFALLTVCLVIYLIKLRICSESWWILSVSAYANSEFSVIQWITVVYEQFLIAL